MHVDGVRQWVRDNTQDLELRQYQLEAWQALWQARASGQKRALIHLATGLGKTSVAAVDVLRYQLAEKPGGRALFVVHVNDIITQARQTYRRVHPGFMTALYKSGGRQPDVAVTFATFQSLYANLDSLDPSYYDYIVWDEAHHIEALTFKQVRSHFTPTFELGLSATPERGDGRDITDYFGQPLYTKGLANGMSEGWLSPVDYHIVFDKTLKKAISDKFDVGTVKELRALFQVKVRDEAIAKEVAKRRSAIGLDKAKTIVFCHSIENAEHIARLLGGKAYHANLLAEEKRQMLKDFRNGTLPVICTIDMFNEGIDIPDARLVVFLRSTSSKTIFEQQLGRGLRKSPGKTHVTVLDFVANIERINFVAELGRHLNRRKDYGEREGTSGRVRGESEILKFNFGTTFEFDDLAVQLLDKYSAVKRPAVGLLPEDRITIAEATRILSVTESVIRGFIKRKMFAHTYDYFKSGSSTVIGLTAQQVDDFKKYIEVRSDRGRKNVTEEAAIEAYKRLGSSIKASKELGISATRIYHYLKKAGIDTSGHLHKGLSNELIAKTFEELGSASKAAKALGITGTTVIERLRPLGYEFKHAPRQHTDEQYVEAYERLGTVRAAARELGVTHWTVGKRLNALGYNFNKITNQYKRKLAKAYQDHNGSIPEIVKDMKLGWTKVYRLLDELGYLERQPSVAVTSAQAAAAYYKFGTSRKAGVHLGVSPSLVSRLSKDARYIRKYKAKAPGVEVAQ